MQRVDAIRRSPLFAEHLGRIEAAETERAFCGHGLAHLLDVARIAWICALERGDDVPKDVVYAAALLHDVGRSAQYATGEDHDVAGVRIACDILDGLPAGLRFDDAERAAILDAVAGHRGELAEGERSAGGEDRRRVLARLIKEADGRSRACYACPAREACYWPDERKNMAIDI